MTGIALLFLLVFLLNLIPAFAPPTWMVFSIVGFRFPEQSAVLLALVGALAATSGRFVLAKGSHLIVRRHLLGEASIRNVDAIKEFIGERRKTTFGAMLFFAFTPFPSNALFIAYGLTTLDLKLITIPFFIGRWVSYSFWAFTASAIAGRVTLEGTETFGYLGAYFVMTQALLLAAVWVFTRIDWRALFSERKLRWLRPDRAPAIRQ